MDSGLSADGRRAFSCLVLSCAAYIYKVVPADCSLLVDSWMEKSFTSAGRLQLIPQCCLASKCIGLVSLYSQRRFVKC